MSSRKILDTERKITIFELCEAVAESVVGADSFLRTESMSRERYNGYISGSAGLALDLARTVGFDEHVFERLVKCKAEEMIAKMLREGTYN